jgi:hypothetical protein
VHDFVDGARVRGQPRHRRAAIRRERLAEVERRLGPVDVAAAERERVAADDAGEESEDGEPPARGDGVPVAAELDFLLGVDVELARPAWALGDGHRRSTLASRSV